MRHVLYKFWKSVTSETDVKNILVVYQDRALALRAVKKETDLQNSEVAISK